MHKKNKTKGAVIRENREIKFRAVKIGFIRAKRYRVKKTIVKH